MAVAHKEEGALMRVCLMEGAGDKLKQHMHECFDVCMDGHASLQNRTCQIGYTVRNIFSIAMVMHVKGQSSSSQQSCTVAHAHTINLLLDIMHQMCASKLFKLQIFPSLPALCQCTFPLLSFNYHVTHLQTCRLTRGIFTHHSPIPLRKCFLPGVMRSELYSLPYVSTPNVSCLTEMVREREKKHIICESRFQICVFTVRWWSGAKSPQFFKSEWKLVQLVWTLWSVWRLSKFNNLRGWRRFDMTHPICSCYWCES